tara:strand:- start:797 stop:2554 length:1758 start_codon:yes stop_codon:yes gene_type:complete
MRAFARKHPIIWAYCFIAFFSLSYHLPIFITGMSGSTGLRQTLLMSFLWLLPVVLLPRYTRQVLAVAGLVMWPAALTSIFYFLIYGQEFSQSAIFIAFESNAAESSEFIQSYWQWWFVPLLMFFTLIPLWMWRQLRPIDLSRRQQAGYGAVFTLIAFWPFIGTLAAPSDRPEGLIAQATYHQIIRMEPAAPWNLVFGYVKYQEQMAEMASLLEQNRKVKPLQNLVAVDTLPDTVVLVLGESTNRQRMSLYGYPRETTPRLDALHDQGELLVFNDVVTPRPYTIEALQQILSFADSKSPERFFNEPTLLNMMKQAGYEITWITNQQTQTRRNTMLTTFSQMADHQVYLNNNRQQNANQYDGAVLKPVEAALASAAPKKLIIVHMLGTHRGYSYRYPESFAHFKDTVGAPDWITPELLAEYNSYDNAVRYNDDVVASLIDVTRARDDNSLLVFFSDHGEEVYDNPEKLSTGRNEGAPTSAMYTVPFVVWASPEFKQHRDLSTWAAAVDRPYSNAHFIHTFAEMVGLSFTALQPQDSLISAKFVPSTRWIGDPYNPKTLRDYSLAVGEKVEKRPLKVAEANQSEQAGI